MTDTTLTLLTAGFAADAVRARTCAPHTGGEIAGIETQRDRALVTGGAH